MNITKAITTLTLLLTLTVAVSAQAAYVLRNVAAGGDAEGFYLPSAAYPSGENAANPRVPTLPLPHFASGASSAPAMIPGQGGLAVDQRTATMISSDGLSIWEEPHPRYPRTWTALPPVPSPFVSPTGSPIMGLTTDATNNFLWMCDDLSFQAFDITYPYNPISGLFPVFPTFAHSQFTGIAYDNADNTLWLCDIQGCVYHVDTAGAPIGLQPVACVPTLLKGIAVNNGDGAGSWPPSTCSSAIGGFHIMVTNGSYLIDPMVFGGVWLSLAAPGDTYGLAYSSDAQYSHGQSPGAAASMRIERPFTRDVGPIAMLLEGTPRFAPAYLLFDLCPLSPGIPLVGGRVRVTTLVLTTTTDFNGRTTVMLPADILPAGFELTLQWAYFGDITPSLTVSGFDLTNAMTLTNSLL